MVPSRPSIAGSLGWQALREGELEFATKFQDDQMAHSFFLHALAAGFIRSRYASLSKVIRRGQADDLNLEHHEGPELPSCWWRLLLDDDPRTDLAAGRACFGNAWGQAEAVVEGIESYRPDVVTIISRKRVGGRPFEKVHWQRMTMHVVDIVRNGDFDRFATFTEFKKDVLEAIGGCGDALSDRAIDAPAKQLWDQYQRTK